MKVDIVRRCSGLLRVVQAITSRISHNCLLLVWLLLFASWSHSHGQYFPYLGNNSQSVLCLVLSHSSASSMLLQSPQTSSLLRQRRRVSPRHPRSHKCYSLINSSLGMAASRLWILPAHHRPDSPRPGLHTRNKMLAFIAIKTKNGSAKRAGRSDRSSLLRRQGAPHRSALRVRGRSGAVLGP